MLYELIYHLNDSERMQCCINWTKRSKPELKRLNRYKTGCDGKG